MTSIGKFWTLLGVDFLRFTSTVKHCLLEGKETLWFLNILNKTVYRVNYTMSHEK